MQIYMCHIYGAPKPFENSVPLHSRAFHVTPSEGTFATCLRPCSLLRPQVYDTPKGHVTRDYKEGNATLGDLSFKVIDTSGLEPLLPGDTIQGRATAATARLLKRSDAAVLLLDARQVSNGGLQPC